MIGSSTGVSYVLPIRAQSPMVDDEFCEYLRAVSLLAETIVVDGSEPDVFAAHAESWGKNVLHVRPDKNLATPMGKVGGVLTGIRLASFPKTIIADDDIRYDGDGLRSVAEALDTADVVRPQNYFTPLPWHAKWDTGRILLNRMTGGDWPGTLGVARDLLLSAGGYDGTVMFENLELVRTIVAVRGREKLLPHVFVPRRPSTARHFWSQRIRQAYDEFARPGRMAFQLALIPFAVLGVMVVGWSIPLAMAITSVALAEAGRRTNGGSRVFPPVTAWFAPAWLMERSVCVWLAVCSRAMFGGIPYRGTVLRRAANPLRVLRRQLGLAAQSPDLRAPEPRHRSV